MFPEYDVIVVGGGHAGCEAAHISATLGSRVLLVTMNMNTIAQMSCNPAMGGVAKGQLVREIDALGGMAGIVTDETMIQFRMLNKSKGPAMWSPRAQSDRMRFAESWRNKLEQNPFVDFWQEMATELIIENSVVKGIKTGLGLSIFSKTVILTNGTFLNGIIHIGEKKFGGGRAGERASKGFTAQLNSVGFTSGRMKTGTPPRVDGRSIDFDKLEVQFGDEKPSKFSFTDTKVLEKQRPCHIGYTNPEVHDVLKTGFEQSPMFNGRIQGIGPRYCPSIEDKIERFSHKNEHQLFIEPEGWDTCEYYINGFSSSLPENVQHHALRKIKGFENSRMFRPGYAIEYDFFHPQQLNLNLETKLIKNLFFAGQINGTTGYEEAGAQGLMAGFNAVRSIREEEPFILKRNEAYIGVLIDDLVNKGTDEPYRMFTSRSEFRLSLRQDNADLRLTSKGYALGSISRERFDQFLEKEQSIKEIIKWVKNTSIEPKRINPILREKKSADIPQKIKSAKVLLRPEMNLVTLLSAMDPPSEIFENASIEVMEQSEIQIKYEGYIHKEKEMASKLERLEEINLPDNFPYDSLKSLSSEGKEKLNKVKPRSLGQASRISGVSQSDISVLMVYMGR